MSAETIWQSKLMRISGSLIHTTNIRTHTAWQMDGNPAAGPIPSRTISVPDNTTVGGILQTNPGFGQQKWLTSLLSISTSFNGTMTLYDRLLHCGNLDPTITTEQFFDPIGQGYVPVTRYTNGINNQIWIEVYGDIVGSAQPSPTFSISYLNEVGAPAVAISAFVSGSGPGLSEPSPRTAKLVLSTTDLGVTAIKSVTLSNANITAGNFGVIVIHPLVYSMSRPNLYEAANQGQVEILSNACLAWYYAILNTVVAINGFPLINACFTMVSK